MNEQTNQKRHCIPSVINKAYVRTYALTYAKDNRAHPFTRVSAEFVDMVGEATKRYIRARVDEQPSRGKTLT